MTESAYGPPIYPPQRPRRSKTVLIAVAALIIGVGTTLAVMKLAGRHGSRPPATPATVAAAPTPTTLTMSGHISLRHYDKDADPSFRIPNWSSTSSGGCEGRHGFDDMTEGADVTVYDANGNVIGSSSLGAGIHTGSICEWPFEVEGLPDSSFYQVEVSHRGKVTIRRGELDFADLTLG